MRRSVTVVVGALLLLAVSVSLWKARGTAAPSPRQHTESDAAALLDQEGRPDGGSFDAQAPEELENAGASTPSPDAAGAWPRALPTSAPKIVRFGVILVQYRGAEGAASSARSHQEAASLAQALAEAAKADFRGQVAKGDPGSLEDAGRIPRGVLEPALEFPLFTLDKGAVSEPLDTPRGFWIVKRIE